MSAKRIQKDEILSQVKAAVFAYGLNAMASDLGKPYSTLSNELDQRDYAKLGFVTALTIFEHANAPYAPDHSRAAALAALDRIEQGLGRVAFAIPDPPANNRAPQLMRKISRLSREFSEAVSALADAVDDGVLEKPEIEACHLRIENLLRACLRIRHYLQQAEPCK